MSEKMLENAYLPFKAKIVYKIQHTETDWTYRLACNLNPEPGQFVEVSIPGVGECPISISDFGEGYIELTIRRVGKVTGVIDEMKVGDFLFLRGPYGNGFPLDEFNGKHVVIAAGGTGLAPVKSLITRFYEGCSNFSQLSLIAGFRSPGDMLFRNEIEKWGQHFPVQVSVDRVSGGDTWQGRVCLVTMFIPELEIARLEETRVILVGPPVMMKYSALEFLKRGIKEEQIWVSFERRMCCGLGKCGHCRIDDTYVCLEGPVFNYAVAKNLVD